MSKRRNWFCGSEEHRISRRSFLSTAAATAGSMSALNLLREPTLAEELKKQDKRVILLWLAGGASQLETWDPKPGSLTGGPFAAIPTSVPGIHISELMPKMARRMEDTAIIRSLNTKDGSHGGGARLMHLGRRDEASVTFPDMGAVLARELGNIDSRVPDNVSFYTATEGRGNAIGQAGFLGARYLPMSLTTNSKPDDLARLESISDLDHRQRHDLRELLSKRFIEYRHSSSLRSHNEAYSRVRGLMSSDKLFDISEEPQSIRDRYGPSLFAEQCLIARRLVEAGTPFVKVSRAWWDSHGQNFETHLELVSELDHVMSTLLDDLKQRGLLENTMVITLAEFERTPKINASLGRDHFASAWSCSLSGCGINGGMVYGATDEDGQTVKDGEIDAGDLFATIYQALGIDPHTEYYVGSRPIPLVHEDASAVKEVIA
ncbi:hypothetical protein Pan97_38880 [Bremerella volcania]|uniref:Sulfatase n=1 Tax=Bremerella volcania TaxID=2527984 RepID=A0A518CC90_9BACT|nr:DUF1501 domain-containing protein [Bremerella volcania]QDU76831.1 hypothetical protein Pan97_38880 [Bremerella volcania]